jgi:hypothetical protein
MIGNEPHMSGPDRVLTDGFPDGWFLEDRPGAGEALLCRRSELAFGGVVCVCLRPRATPTAQWVLTAQIIAHGVEAENARRREAPDQRESGMYDR